MRQSFNKAMIITLCLITLFTMTSCKKNNNQYITPITMHSVTFYVDNEQYQKKYVNEGAKVKEISGKNVEGKNFIHWSLNNNAYNFYSSVNENLKLYGVYKDASVVLINDNNNVYNLTEISYNAKDHLNNSPITNLDYRYYIGIKNETETSKKIKIEITPIINFSADLRVRLLEEDDPSAVWYNHTNLKPIEINLESNELEYIIIDWMLVEITPEIIPESYEVKINFSINIVNE